MYIYIYIRCLKAVAVGLLHVQPWFINKPFVRLLKHKAALILKRR